MIKEIKSIEENVGYEKLSFRGGNKKIYYFYKFETLEQLIKDLLNMNLTIDEAERKQNEFDEKFYILRFYPTRRSEYIDLKESVSKNAKKKKNVTDGKKLFMGLKMEYYHFLKRMA